MQSLLAEVSLPRIRRNADVLLSRTKKPLIAVVKDDGYGHGAIPVAHALHGKATMFAVSTVEEGVSLRIAGVTEPILVLTPPLDLEDATTEVWYDLVADLSSYPVLRLLARAGEETGRRPRAHISVNTGMNRYGFLPEETSSAAREAKNCDIDVEGVFSHLYLPSDERAREKQNERFRVSSEEVKTVFPEALRHLSATGAVDEDEWDAVRVGLALYGYGPSVRPAARLFSFVSHATKQLEGGLGYASAEKNFGDVFTLRLGYGDGFFREGAPFAEGKLCMDASVCVGKEKFGERKLVLSDFDAYAKEHNTTVYEALVKLLSKAEKRYVC